MILIILVVITVLIMIMIMMIIRTVGPSLMILLTIRTRLAPRGSFSCSAGSSSHVVGGRQHS